MSNVEGMKRMEANQDSGEAVIEESKTDGRGKGRGFGPPSSSQHPLVRVTCILHIRSGLQR